MLFGFEDGGDDILGVGGEFWEHELPEDAGVVDEILFECFHLLPEGLLVGLALEFIRFLEDGAEFDVFDVDEDDLKVPTDEDQLELLVAIW